VLQVLECLDEFRRSGNYLALDPSEGIVLYMLFNLYALFLKQDDRVETVTTTGRCDRGAITMTTSVVWVRDFVVECFSSKSNVAACQLVLFVTRLQKSMGSDGTSEWR
jgi:hypothetical protein